MPLIRKIKTPKDLPKSIPFPQPNKYQKIDNYISRSAQPKKQEFNWLKEHGVTDIVSFNSIISNQTQTEQKALSKLGINFHWIPTVLTSLNESRITKFFELVKDIKASNGKRKLHMHDNGGINKVGFYTLLYKSKFEIDSFDKNLEIEKKLGFDTKSYSDLIEYIKNKFVKK